MKNSVIAFSAASVLLTSVVAIGVFKIGLAAALSKLCPPDGRFCISAHAAAFRPLGTFSIAVPGRRV